MNNNLKITDELHVLRENTEKARTMIGEVVHEYFDRFDAHDQEDKISIAWEFERNRIYSKIAYDYLNGLTDDLERIEKHLSDIKKENRIS